MEVVLQEHINNLGKMGEIVSVAPGYARNYLLPKGKAVLANRVNKKALEHQLKTIEAKKLKVLATLEDLAQKIESISLTIPFFCPFFDLLFFFLSFFIKIHFLF